MPPSAIPCPRSARQLLDEHFLDQRHHLLEIAAFLDRLDRAARSGDEGDFRLRALREAIQLLGSASPTRTEAVLMLLSDPRREALAGSPAGSAAGAYDRSAEEVR